MFRTVSRLVAMVAGFLVLVGVLLLAGFSMSYFEVGPANAFTDRVLRKVAELRGEPSELEQRFATIDATTVRLAGEVYELPNNDFIRGGGMAVWDDDLLLVSRSGDVFHFVDGQGLVRTEIETPDNGLAAYQDLARSEEHGDMVHKPETMRYNDLIHVDTPDLTGLAVSYTFFDEERTCYGSRIAWLQMEPGTSFEPELRIVEGDWEIVLETSPCLKLNPTWTALDGLMAGGRMAFEAPSTLYYGSGEYHLDGVHTYDIGIQEDDNDYGKVIAVDLLTGVSRHVSKGHRNMQGVALDLEGRLWVTEHMIRGGDELNLVEEGNNYGWPLETLGTLYSGQPFPNEGPAGRHELFDPPVYAWLPSAAISSLTVIDGFHPTWDGDLLAGSLSNSEFGQSLYHIRIRDERALFVERIKLGERVRYLTQYGDRIAVWLDSNHLVLFSSVPRADMLSEALELARADIPEAEMAQVEQVLRNCGQCHAFEDTASGGGPSLAEAYGRDIASGAFDGYSDALRAKPGRWDHESLAAFLSDTQSFAPGTTMPSQNLEGPVLDGVIDVLERLSTIEDLRYD